MSRINSCTDAAAKPVENAINDFDFDFAYEQLSVAMQQMKEKIDE